MMGFRRIFVDRGVALEPFHLETSNTYIYAYIRTTFYPSYILLYIPARQWRKKAEVRATYTRTYTENNRGLLIRDIKR